VQFNISCGGKKIFAPTTIQKQSGLYYQSKKKLQAKKLQANYKNPLYFSAKETDALCKRAF
jgi:hypothetical protein